MKHIARYRWTCILCGRDVESNLRPSMDHHCVTCGGKFLAEPIDDEIVDQRPWDLALEKPRRGRPPKVAA